MIWQLELSNTVNILSHEVTVSCNKVWATDFQQRGLKFPVLDGRMDQMSDSYMSYCIGEFLKIKTKTSEMYFSAYTLNY